MFQNIVHLLAPRTHFGHFWVGEGERVCMSLTRSNTVFLQDLVIFINMLNGS